MTEDTAMPTGAPTAFDKWQTVAIAIFIALIGYTVMVSFPVLATALVEKAGFSEVEVGQIWGADMLGFSVGAILVAFVVAGMNRRTIILVGVVLAVVANALCLVLDSYYAMIALRAAAGVGSGIFTAVSVVTLGGTTKPVVAFNLLLFGFAFSTAAELHFLPRLTMNEIYIFFMILAALCALLVRWIPERPLNAEELALQEAGEDHVEDWHVPRILPVICLIAVCFTYINIGGYYAYIELGALHDGVSVEWTGPVLTWSSIFAIVGCALAYLATRWGLFKPLFISLITMGIVVAMPATGFSEVLFAVSVFGFMTLWTFIDVYQSAMLSHMDRAGSLVALLPSVQGFGQFIGPYLAAWVLTDQLKYREMFLVSGSMAFIALALYVLVSLFVRKREPAAVAVDGEMPAE
jgi:predicted MFS family arabinose efflux permease